MSSSPPLLIVGHGTRDPAGVREFARLIERVQRHSADWLPAVDGGFIELSAPPVSEVISRLLRPRTRRGSRPGPGTRFEPGTSRLQELVAVPLVLTSAGHGKGDIPASLAREQIRHPGLRYRYGRPLGPHPVLLDLLEARIDAALDGLPRADVHVVLVGRGSTDPDANAEVAKVARLLWEGRGYAETELSFISLAEPSVPAALDKARRLGAKRVVVAPYFLFPGALPSRVGAQAAQFAALNADMDIRVAGLIGDCDELAALVLERYHEALHGDIRMNCDTCVYRIALPGFADKVGRPQTPHHHPADPAPGSAHGHTHDHEQHHEHDHAQAAHLIVPQRNYDQRGPDPLSGKPLAGDPLGRDPRSPGARLPG